MYLLPCFLKICFYFKLVSNNLEFSEVIQVNSNQWEFGKGVFPSKYSLYTLFILMLFIFSSKISSFHKLPK